MADKLKLFSLNVRGLKNRLKRLKLFNYLKTQKFDLVCLQESHITNNDIQIWEKEWGGKLFYNVGTGHSKGEVILVSKLFSGTVDLIRAQDRLLIVSVSYEDYNFNLVNIYAPNDGQEKIRFFNILQGILGNFNENEMIVTGDFNCAMNDQLDIITGQPHNRLEKEELNNLIGTLGIYDTWRVLHSDEKDFTWSKTNPFIARRIDYCFCTDVILSSVVYCEHTFMSESDHKGISIELNNSNFKRGPGYWRFNNSLLTDRNFIEQMNDLLDDVNISNTDNPIEKWETCKLEIKSFCVAYGKEKSIRNRNEILDLQNELKQIEYQLINNPTDAYLSRRLIEIKQKIDIIQTNRTKGAQVRARIKWIEEGEKSTKFFFNLEKSRAKKNTITRLESDNGTILTEQKEVMAQQVSFYKNLCNQNTTVENDNIFQRTNEFLNDIDFPKLTDEEAASCEEPIDLREAGAALAKMNNGSAPGRDGITIEFLKFFWSRIGNLIVQSFMESFTKEELSYSQRQGVIILLHKGGELSREKLGNWRPITLTNSDYKLLAKILASRLSNVIGKLVNEDQVGYVKGRNIATNLRTIDDVINYYNEIGRGGYLLALDFSKAFDSVSKTFLQTSFDIFGFGINFKKWVSILNSGTTSCINHGGWLSENFSVSCGIRQGCPFSPLAFVLAVEILAIRIRNCEINGLDLPLNNESIKIKQLADDTTLFLKNKEDMLVTENVMTQFATFSGLKLNNRKTKALKLGTQQLDDGLPFQVEERIKILGIIFQRDKMAKDIEENYLDRIKKVQTLIKNWSRRDLSIHGKILIVKTFLVSQFDFILQSIGLPNTFLQKINTLIYKFIWQRKYSNKKAFEKIKRKVMQNDYEEGGLRMVDMFIIQKSYYLQWAGKVFSSDETTLSNWSILPLWYFSRIFSGKKVFEINCNSKNVLRLNEISNGFWKEVIYTYLNSKTPITIDKINEKNFQNQLLFNNDLIRFRNRILYFKNWKLQGIEKVQDLINVNNNRLYTIDEIQNRFGRNRAVIVFEYNALINAIPQVWKRWIELGNVNATEELVCEAILFNNKPKEIKKMLQSKEIAHPSNAVSFWQRKLGFTVDKRSWIMARNTTNEIRLLELQWKILQNLYPTNILLQKMKVTQTNRCSYCLEIDFIEHFFYHCPYSKTFWQYIDKKISAELGRCINLSQEDVLFGVQLPLNKAKTNYINHTCLVGKMCISIAKKKELTVPIEVIFEFQVGLRTLQSF